jgi:hypothetical protein
VGVAVGPGVTVEKGVGLAVGVAAGLGVVVAAGVALGVEPGVRVGVEAGVVAGVAVAVGTGVTVEEGVAVATGVGVGDGVGSVNVTVAVVCCPSVPLSGLLRFTVKVLLGPTTGLLSNGTVITFDVVSPSFQERSPLVAV